MRIEGVVTRQLNSHLIEEPLNDDKSPAVSHMSAQRPGMIIIVMLLLLLRLLWPQP